LNETEKAYLAGIIDGEGTVTLTKHHRNAMPSPNISIANNNVTLLKWVKRKVDGGVIIEKAKRMQHHHNSYAWSIRFDKAINLLRELKGYLIVKKKQADLILREYKAVTHRNGKYTPEMLVKKADLVTKIRKLNQR
jgi:hypothetical protein